MTLGEVALGALLQVLFQMITNRVMLEFTRLMGLKEQVNRLKDTLFMIQRQIQAADEEADKEWLRKLKDAAYDMEDIWDEINTEYLRVDVKNRKERGEPLLTNLAAARSQDKKLAFPIYPPKVRKLFTKAVRRFGDRKTTKKIEDALDKLEEAAKSRDTLRHGRNTVGGETSANQTRGRIRTFPRRNDSFYGRLDDRQKLLDIIGDETSQSSGAVNYSVVTILGMGGIGKTALARQIYYDVAHLFDLRSWVFAPSIGHDSLEKLIEVMLSHLIDSNNQHVINFGSNYSGRSPSDLSRFLNNNKFFIVIDDVWTVDESEWKNLCAAFQDCGKGSKVVVTTHKEDVAKTMRSRDLHRLQKLEDEHCRKLFKFEAFECRSDAEVTGAVEEEIAKKCKGVPLVADVLGTIFRGNDPSNIRGRDIADTDIWNSPDDIEKIFRHLKMCYYDLPSELKRCFEYFSLFPVDYDFDNFVQLWLAEGFVLPERFRLKQESVMHIGGNCYEELKKRSLLCDDGTMPELLHSLASYIAGNFYYKHDNHLISSQGLHIGSPRHVSFLGKNIEETTLNSLKGYTKMRTILVDSISSKCLDRLLAWKILRVLELGNSRLSELPPSIGKLKHLRYLSLHSSDIESLPDAICWLCNLQTLDLRSCVRLTQLPDIFGELVSLHHLNLRGTGLLSLPNSICAATKLQRLLILDCPNLTNMPPHLGNLTGLRYLSNYLVSDDADCGIRELKRLSHLKRPLIISGLEHVTVVDDAENADLKRKEDLEGVTYMWSRNRQTSNPPSRLEDENVLRALKPSICRLKSLSIDGYGGDEFPAWLWEMINLTHLRLDHCLNITSLPDQGLANLKSLRSLHIKNCSRFNIELQPLPTTLKELCITGVQNLQSLQCRFLDLTSLQSLKIANCEQLRSVSEDELPATLVDLRIQNCSELQSLPQGLNNLTALQCLKVNGSRNMHHLPRELCRCASLKRLVVDYNHLQSLLDEELRFSLEKLCVWGYRGSSLRAGWLQNLTSLSKLKIADFPHLCCMPEGSPTSLKIFSFYKCPNLSSVSALRNLTLENITVSDCPQLPRAQLEDEFSARGVGLRYKTNMGPLPTNNLVV